MRYCIFLILTFMCLHLQGQNIKGTVTDNKGIPVPDVAVSDGINIVKTNANGQYAMQSDKHRGTIFVISPSGYTVPLKKEGLQADFWRHFKLPADKTEEINFTLIPQDQSCYNVMFTTDIHLNNFPPQDDLRRFHEFVMPVVKEIATENAKEGIPMYTFHLGDMSTGMNRILILILPITSSSQKGFRDRYTTLQATMTTTLTSLARMWIFAPNGATANYLVRHTIQ